MIERIKKLLSENPDNIYFKDGSHVGYNDGDDIAFALHDGIFYISKKTRQSHKELVKNTTDLKKLVKKDFKPDSTGYFSYRGWLDYPGRFWYKSKIISFWKYPSVQDFKKVIQGIKEKTNYMYGDDWRVQVHDEKGEEILIPIADYQGDTFKDKRSSADDHVASPMQKKKKQGTGMQKVVLPKNMTLAQYHNIIKQEGVEYSNKVKGGRGDKLKPSDVDQNELKMGISHEMEHTKDKQIAQEIALDHLSEDPKYYTNLKKKGIK